MTASKENCEMLPCPLCGRQPDYQHFNISQNTRGRIICTCGLGLTQGRNDTEDGTILKWNTRSDHAVQAANERKAEQAIAATVGTRTDLASRLREVTGLRSFAELFGFSWEDGSDWDWHDVACAMADAIDVTVGGYAITFAPTLDRPPETMVGETVFDSEGNAIGWIVNVAAGVGTCTMKPDGYYGEEYGIYKCSNCGELWQFECDGPKEHGWTCCPHCRARIIKEVTE